MKHPEAVAPRKPGEKPTISDEARARIKAFVAEVEAAQRRHGIHIWVQDDTIALRDVQRSDQWDGGGLWDARFYDADPREKPGRLFPIRVKNLEIENFDWWDA